MFQGLCLFQGLRLFQSLEWLRDYCPNTVVHSGSRLWWIAKRNFMTWTQATSYKTQCGILTNFLSTFSSQHPEITFFRWMWHFDDFFCQLFKTISLCILLFFVAVNQKRKLRSFVAESRKLTMEWNSFWRNILVFIELYFHKILIQTITVINKSKVQKLFSLCQLLDKN